MFDNSFILKSESILSFLVKTKDSFLEKYEIEGKIRVGEKLKKLKK